MRTLTTDHIAPLIHALTAFIGQANADKCLATWRNTLGNARPVERAQADQAAFYWWPGLAQFRERKPGTPYSMATLLLAKDAMKVLAMVDTMPASVKKDFAGALGSVPTAPGHLHEVAMAHHLADLGCEIRWVEQSGQGIPEFLAITPSLTFEVECKRLSVDAGRQLARGAFARFGDVIVGCLRQRKRMGRIHMELARRLPKPAEQLQIAATLGAAIDAGHVTGVIDLAPWGHADLSLQAADDVVMHWDAVQAAARAQHAPEQHTVLYGQPVPGGAANPIHLTAASMERDAYLRTIYKTMKAAARSQLSGRHPALLCIHIPEIGDFSSLLEESALKDMTAYFFSQAEHAHVFAVAYTSDTHVTWEPSGYHFAAEALAFKNANCSFPDALGFRLFAHEAMPPAATPAVPDSRQRAADAQPLAGAVERYDEQT